MTEPVTIDAPGELATPRLRVLWAIKGLGRGGAEQLLVSAAEVADHERFTYEACYVLPHKDALVDALAGRGVRVHSLAASTGRSSGRAWLWPWRLRRLLVERRYDVVHVHSPVLAAVVRVLAATIPRPRPHTVYTQHNVWQSYARTTRLAEATTRRLDSHRFAVSSAVAGSNPPRLRRSTELLIHGVPTRDALPTPEDRAGARARLRSALWLPESAPVVITVANLRVTKDHANLLAAARLVADARPDVHFLVVGDGPLRAELEALAVRLGLEGQVHFLGSRSDVADLLLAADLFVLASLHEGLPIAMLEAMVAGLPAVLTAVGGIPEAVTDRAEALLVPARDPRALAAGILEICADPALADDLGRRARVASRRFDIRAAVRGYERAYVEVVRCVPPSA
jgi:glycosyltransferase involved in cell wall biosynthesis